MKTHARSESQTNGPLKKDKSSRMKSSKSTPSKGTKSSSPTMLTSSRKRSAASPRRSDRKTPISTGKKPKKDDDEETNRTRSRKQTRSPSNEDDSPRRKKRQSQSKNKSEVESESKGRRSLEKRERLDKRRHQGKNRNRDNESDDEESDDEVSEKPDIKSKKKKAASRSVSRRSISRSGKDEVSTDEESSDSDSNNDSSRTAVRFKRAHNRASKKPDKKINKKAKKAAFLSVSRSGKEESADEESVDSDSDNDSPRTAIRSKRAHNRASEKPDRKINKKAKKAASRSVSRSGKDEESADEESGDSDSDNDSPRTAVRSKRAHNRASEKSDRKNNKKAKKASRSVSRSGKDEESADEESVDSDSDNDSPRTAVRSKRAHNRASKKPDKKSNKNAKKVASRSVSRSGKDEESADEESVDSDSDNDSPRTAVRSKRAHNRASKIPDKKSNKKDKKEASRSVSRSFKDRESADEESVDSDSDNDSPRTSIRSKRAHNRELQNLDVSGKNVAPQVSYWLSDTHIRGSKIKAIEKMTSGFEGEVKERKLSVAVEKLQDVSEKSSPIPVEIQADEIESSPIVVEKQSDENSDIEVISDDNGDISGEDDDVEELAEPDIIKIGSTPPKKMKSGSAGVEVLNISDTVTYVNNRHQLETGVFLKRKITLLEGKVQLLTNSLKLKNVTIQRLKNEIKWKDEQLEDLNGTLERNMELEAKISHLLSDSKAYEKEVEDLSTRVTNKKAKKDQKKKEKDQESEKEESQKKEKDKKGEDDEGKSKKRRRSKRRKKNESGSESSGDDIDALFVDEENDIEIIDTTDNCKVDSKEPKNISKDQDNDVEFIKEVLPEKTSSSRNDVVIVEEQRELEDQEDDKMKGRRDIRRLLSGRKIQEETKLAARAEKERRERVKKAREEHLIVTETNAKTEKPVTSRLVLAFKEGTKTALVEVNQKLIKKLKPHQVEAVEFMWDNLIESMERFKENDGGSGCIVAHCMGLGKTLSVITTVHTMMNTKCMEINRCLVVAPLNALLNWEYEFEKWLPKKERPLVHGVTKARDKHERIKAVTEWHKQGGVLVIGYQLFRIFVNYKGKSSKKKKALAEALVDPGPDIVVCDEGHMLKNDASAISKCMSKIRTKRRIALTGTPLQNNLIEYHCMVNFVKTDLLGTRREFCNRFVNPITNGQHADSTPRDVTLMKRRSHVLHEMLSGFVQRKDYSVIAQFLPPKHEYIIAVRLSKIQMELYQKYLDLHCTQKEDGGQIGAGVFADYQCLMRIWTHPWVLKLDEIRQEKKGFADDMDDELDFYTSSEEEEEMSSKDSDSPDEDGSDEDSSTSNRSSKQGSKKSDSTVATRRSSRNATPKAEASDAEEPTDESSSGCKTLKPRTVKLIAGEVIRQWKSRSRGAAGEELEEVRPKEDQWWESFVNEEDKFKMELSGKLVLLFEILRMAEQLGDKVLLFSQSLLSLDLIEEYLEHQNEMAKNQKGQKKKKKASSWVFGEDYYRMDGSTTSLVRQGYVDEFSDTENKRLRLFLISTKAGGLGINLDSANRVIIFDASWNPSHDIQSIFRTYRFGQEKDVFVYRFLAQGTMEEKIYERQVTKETLSQRVVDEHQIDRHFNAADLQELYNFKPDRLDDPDRPAKPTPAVPQDVILAELLSTQKDYIVQYHEHDSLLENRPDQDLTEEERKAAWEEYERERTDMFVYPTFNNVTNTAPAPFFRQFPGPFPTHRQVIPGGLPMPGLGGQFTLSGVSPSPFIRIQCRRPRELTPMPNAPGHPNFQYKVTQLPRIIQEIVKYNPSIKPGELQERLKAFMGMHGKPNVFPLTTGAASGSNQFTFSSGQGISQFQPSSAPSRLPLPGMLPATSAKQTQGPSTSS